MLSLVLPKGSLERATLQLFEDADLAVQRGSDVDYRADVDDPRIESVRILRPQEIPRYVAAGTFDLGITGRDWIEETNAEVVTLAELHYSKATARPIRVVLAVAAGSPALLYAGSVVAGVGFGPAFSGVFRSLAPLAPPHARSALLAAIYVVSYLSFSLPAVAAGLAAAHWGLRSTTYVYGIAVMALALATTIAVARRQPHAA